MSEYKASTTINASADALFEYMSHPENMPEYMPTVDTAESQGEGRIHMTGDSPGGHYDADGKFQVDKEARTMKWSSDGENKYSGMMSVQGDEKTSELSVQINFEPRPDQVEKFDEMMKNRDQGIKDSIQRAVEAIKTNVEAKGTVPKAEV